MECPWTGRAHNGRPLLKPIEHLGVGYSYSKPVGGRSSTAVPLYLVQFILYSKVIMSNWDQM